MTFNSKLRQNEATFKLVRQVVEHLCTVNNLQFATVWPTVSTKDCEHYERHFRRERRRNDPLRDVKKVRTAFSFFTQEQRPLITAKHPELPFGEVSKLVGQQWSSLDQATRAKYQAEEAKDKTRYEGERQAIMKDIATKVVSVSAPAEVAESAPTPAKRATGAKGGKKETAPAPAPAVESAPATAQASAPAKRGGKKAVASAPVAESAPAPASAPAPVAVAPAKRGGKKAVSQASA